MSIDTLLSEIKTSKAIEEEKQYIMAHLKTIPAVATLAAYAPKREWFTTPTKIHGIMHETRVLVYVELLGQMTYVEYKIDVESLRYAAITHDVKRINDWYDFPHGARAAKWLLDTKPIPEQYCLSTAEIVKWHVTQDIAIPKMTKELEVFKDADGLDRWRIGDLNTNYLRTSHSVNMVETAKALFLLSNALKEQGAEDFTAVLESGRLLGILQ